MQLSQSVFAMASQGLEIRAPAKVQIVKSRDVELLDLAENADVKYRELRFPGLGGSLDRESMGSEIHYFLLGSSVICEGISERACH